MKNFTSLYYTYFTAPPPLYCISRHRTPQLHCTASPLLRSISLHRTHYIARSLLRCTVLITLPHHYSSAVTALQPLYSDEFHCTASSTLHPTAPLHFTALYSLHCTTTTLHQKQHCTTTALRCSATPLLNCISLHCIHYTSLPLFHWIAPTTLYPSTPLHPSTPRDPLLHSITPLQLY